MQAAEKIRIKGLPLALRINGYLVVAGNQAAHWNQTDYALHSPKNVRLNCGWFRQQLGHLKNFHRPLRSRHKGHRERRKMLLHDRRPAGRPWGVKAVLSTGAGAGTGRLYGAIHRRV